MREGESQEADGTVCIIKRAKELQATLQKKLGRREGFGEGSRAGEHREVGELHPQCERAPRELTALQTPVQLLDHLTKVGFDDEGLSTILLEGALTAETLTYPLIDDGALIYPTSEVIEDTTRLTEVAGQLLEASLPKISPRTDTQEVHTLSRSTPYPPEGFDRELGDEVQRLRRMDRAEPVGLARVGSNLREELIVRHTRRSR